MGCWCWIGVFVRVYGLFGASQSGTFLGEQIVFADSICVFSFFLFRLHNHRVTRQYNAFIISIYLYIFPCQGLKNAAKR